MKHIIFANLDLTVPCFNFSVNSNEKKKDSLIDGVT